MPLTERRMIDGISAWALIEGANLRNLVPDLSNPEISEAIFYLRPEEAIKYTSVTFDWMMFGIFGYTNPDYVSEILKEGIEIDGDNE